MTFDMFILPKAQVKDKNNKWLLTDCFTLTVCPELTFFLAYHTHARASRSLNVCF